MNPNVIKPGSSFYWRSPVFPKTVNNKSYHRRVVVKINSSAIKFERINCNRSLNPLLNVVIIEIRSSFLLLILSSEILTRLCPLAMLLMLYLKKKPASSHLRSRVSAPTDWMTRSHTTCQCYCYQLLPVLKMK